MLNLIFAPSADKLVSLAENEIRKAWNDPFNPPAIIIPNPTVGKWLNVRLAESRSLNCIVGARMITLEKFLLSVLDHGAKAKLLDADNLSQIICALLDEKLLEKDIYAPLKNYLCNNDYYEYAHRRNFTLGNNNNIDALKRVQLSAHIARQFLEYEYNRPSVWSEETGKWSRYGIDAMWLQGKFYFDDFEHEAWQMDLYRRVYECFQKESGLQYTTLPHLYRHRREECIKEKRMWCDVGANRQIILFGVSKISHFHRTVLVEISQTTGVDMYVFLTNPCAEFWEDIDTSRRSFAPRRRWSSNSPPEQAGIKPIQPVDYDKPELDMFADEEDHTLLKMWGGAGKENIFLWCPQAQWNFEYVTDNDSDNISSANMNLPAGNDVSDCTLLKSIQKSLLRRDNALEYVKGDIKDDKSLEILACPDISREVEEVRELILDMAHNGTIRDFSDVMVYMPSPNKYLPHIQRVFGAYSQNDPLHIPFSILGASSGSNMVASAWNALLNIIGGNFNRAQIFELLKNPIVQASKNISLKNVTQWEYWAEEFGMFRGFNAAQRESMGDLGDAVTDEHTFERGMRRVLESIDASDDDARLSEVNVTIDAMTQTDVRIFGDDANCKNANKKRTADIFISLLEELNDLSAQYAKNNFMLSICEAVECIRKAAWQWLQNIPIDGSVNSAAETRARLELFDGLDKIMLQHTSANRVNIGQNEFIALARNCVPEESSYRSPALNGIAFMPLRTTILPSRAIFVLGLGASEFPGANEKGSWDLLSRGRIVGDSDRVRENRFAFLELLHAAKERLILSYRARDMQKDEPLQPSSVILELEEFLIDNGITDGEENLRRCAIRRDVGWVVHESLYAALKNGRKHGTWDKTQRELADQSAMKRFTHRRDLMKKSTKTDKPAEVETLATIKKSASINDIKQFFENPLEYHLYKTLGIRDDDDDASDMSAVNEPLNSGVALYKLRRNIWKAVLRMIFPSIESAALPVVNEEELIDSAANKAGEIYDAHMDLGKAPEGHIRRMEREALLLWAKSCATSALNLSKHFSNHQFIEHSEYSFNCDRFIINGYHAQAVISKNISDTSLDVGLISFAKDKNIGDNHKLWLDGTAQLLCDIKNNISSRKVSLILLNIGEKPKEYVSPLTIDPQKINDTEKWLMEMVSQMSEEKRCEHLPFTSIAELVKPKKKKKGKTDDDNDDTGASDNFNERLQHLTFDALKNHLRRNQYKAYLSAFQLTDAKPTDMSDEELRKLVYIRYAPILERWIHE